MTIGTLYNAANVAVGQAAVLFAPDGTALPAFSATVPSMTDPFDASAFTGMAPVPWVTCGATDQGWKFGANKSISEINIEEQSTPVNQEITSQKVTIDGTLSEDISATLALAISMQSTIVVPGSAMPGHTNLVLSDTVAVYAVCLLTTNSLGLPRWIYAPRWTQLSNTSVDFRRAAAKHMYPVSFATICAPSLIQIIDFTAKATA